MWNCVNINIFIICLAFYSVIILCLCLVDPFSIQHWCDGIMTMWTPMVTVFFYYHYHSVVHVIQWQKANKFTPLAYNSCNDSVFVCFLTLFYSMMNWWQFIGGLCSFCVGWIAMYSKGEEWNHWKEHSQIKE